MLSVLFDREANTVTLATGETWNADEYFDRVVDAVCPGLRTRELRGGSKNSPEFLTKEKPAMDVETLTMEPEAALDLLGKYRAGLRKRKDEEWEAAAKALEEMRDGTHLIDVGQVLRVQDLVPDDFRPTLAIARADRKEVAFRWNGGRTLRYDSRRPQSNAASDTLDLLFSWDGSVEWKKQRVGYAMVPMIPPDADVPGSKLKYHFVLWEVEEGGWADRRENADMDPDPFLLRPILGWLCAIVHEWDLTPIERAIAEAVRR